jgi:transposase
LEAGKQRAAGNTKREATSMEVTDLKKEHDQLKRLLGELMLKNNVLKKSVLGSDSTWEDE